MQRARPFHKVLLGRVRAAKRRARAGLRGLTGWVGEATGIRGAGRGGAPSRELLELSWPIATAMLGETAMSLVDTKLVGALGAPALAGVGMAAVVVYLCQAVVFGLMRGVKIRAAYAVGEGRADESVRYALAGAAMGLVAGLLVWSVTRDATPLLSVLHVDATTLAYARDFLAARTWGAPAACAAAALIQHRQAVGDARTPMRVGLCANVVNAVLAWALIHGHFGLPALGVRGAGFGTACAEWLQLALLALPTLLARRRAGARVPSGRSLWRAAREVAALGIPTGLHFGLEMLAFGTFTALLGSMGSTEMAAHQIALGALKASFLPGVAVAEAASVLVGRALGRGRPDEASRVVRSALALAVGFMVAVGLALGTAGAAIASLFTEDAAVVTVTSRLLWIAAAFQALDAVNIVLRGSLRGAKDVRWVAVVGTSIVWCCVPGGALVFGKGLGWGAAGGWCGFVLETTLASALLGWRWARGPWRRATAVGLDAQPRAEPAAAA